MLRTILISLFFCLTVVAHSKADRIVVDVYGSGDYLNIQDGIDNANYGDVILVKDGIYTGLRNKNLDFGGRAITVVSENGPQFTEIDCEHDGRGFQFHSNEDSNSVLSGFTITNGSANIVSRAGGGILCEASSPTIDNCIMLNNSALGINGFGGGIACIDSSPKISNCRITNNHTNSHGGGIYCRNSNPIIKNCVITYNTVEAYGNGAGVCCYIGVVTISNSIIANNKTGSIGGSVFSGNGGRSIINHCTIVGNIAHRGAAFGEGFSTISNSIIWGHNSFLYRPQDFKISYSNIQGGMSGEGNINFEPGFVDLENGDYHLLLNSYCIDAGDPTYLAEYDETDIEGVPRVMNGRVDMGAYEYNIPITVEVDIKPKKLNLSSKGRWITCEIRFPEGYDINNVDAQSIRLMNEINAESVLFYNQGRVVVLKFNRLILEDFLKKHDLSDRIELTVVGNFHDYIRFKGADTIEVIDY